MFYDCSNMIGEKKETLLIGLTIKAYRSPIVIMCASEIFDKDLMMIFNNCLTRNRTA